MNDLLRAALQHHEAGRCVLSVRENKEPHCGKGWNRWFKESQSEDEVRGLFSNGAHGLAIIQYPASPIITLDDDGIHAQDAWRKTGIELIPTAKSYTKNNGIHRVYRIPADTTLLDRLKRKVRLVKADCNCVDKDGKLKQCGVDLLLRGYSIEPPTPGYREDPDFPLEDAVEIQREVLELALRHQDEERKGERKTGDADGKVRRGEQHNVAISLVGTMRRRGMSVDAIRAALKADSEARFEPPLTDNEIDYFAGEAGKWEPGEECFHLTDLGNARRFAKQHHGTIHYCFEREQWLFWNRHAWLWDKSGEVMTLAKATVLSIYNEASNEKDPDRRTALAQHAVKSETNTKIQAMLNLAKSEPGIPVTLDQLDRYPLLFNVQNGIIDLETGELLEHSPTYLITQLSPCIYDPDASCDRYLAFLNRIMDNNAEMIAFLQRWFGYCLTADVSEHAVIFAHGKGANGKTTLFKSVINVMGSYADMAAPNLLLAKRNEEHPAGVADLVGKRLVCTVEIEDGRRFDAALFKWLSGGDVIKARFMRENFFSFKPSHKLTIAANHKPFVTDSSIAFWRRMKLCAFNVQIPEAEQDKHLDEKLKDESEGILAWMVRGAVTWRKEGLGEPPEVATATDGYRREQDFLAPFIAECCESGEDFEVSVGDLYERFKSWADESGEKPVSRKRISAMLKERGFENYQDSSDHRFYWKGVKLK